MTPENVQSHISNICDTIKKTLIDKNIEYGNSALDPIRVFSTSNTREQLRVRIDDKLSRIWYIARNEGKIKEDTKIDLIGYLILELVLDKIEFDESNTYAVTDTQ